MGCAATAMTAGTGVAGMRAYLAHRRPAWLTPRRLRRVSAGLLATGVLASGAVLGGGAGPGEEVAASPPAAVR